jgi:group II intron reverse transcriptase/maturase
MAQQQIISYQKDLFTSVNTDEICPSESGEHVERAAAGKALQMVTAGEQEHTFTSHLMEVILSSDNIKRAFKQVKQNKGASGIDQMSIQDFAEWYKLHGADLLSRLYSGNYHPQGVREVEIPKPNGGTRKLGIPTVTDRVIQQAILQVLSPIYERMFSDHSYGFRPNRSAHQALRQSSEYVSDGKTIVVDIDLKNFFDVVNHDRLMYRLSQTIHDKRLLRLIRRYLQSGIMVDGIASQRTEGTPQGSPLSPLLSNIVLDELDKELEKRGHSFVRYADDCNIYVSSQMAGTRVMQSVSHFIENKLKLKVNESKSRVCEVNETKFLGYTIQHEGILTLSSQSTARLKARVRQITRRNRGVKFEQLINELNPLLCGWITYYRYAQCSRQLRNLDAWIRRKLRCYRIKQCKRVITLQKFLESRGVVKWQSWILALSGKGNWRKSNCPQVVQAMGNKWFDKDVGLYNLSLNYVRLNRL